MEWNNTYKSLKELDNRTMIDSALIPCVDPVEYGSGTSAQGNLSSTVKQRKKSMTSVYLKFFETAPDGKSRRCKFCKQSYSIATATGNLGRHLTHRHPGYNQQGDTDQQITQTVAVIKKTHSQAKPPSLDVDHINSLLVKCLIGAHIPPSTMDDELRNDFFMFMNFSFHLWSREKLHEVALEVFQSVREDVRVSLGKVNSKVSITLDFWKSCEEFFYLGIKGHWIDENWSLRNVLLDVCHIPEPRGGAEIALALKKVLMVFNLDKVIISITHDDSPPAIQACSALKEEYDARKMPLFYIPCAARTLNFIIEDHLKCSRPILSKIREFVLKLNTSAEIAQEFRQLTTSYQEGSWKIPLDVSARWTGDYTMLDIVRKASNSIDTVVRKHGDGFGSRSMLLSSTEKSFISTLHAYLEPFYKITSDLCTCKVPTAGLVLFFMDHVFEMINSFRDTCHYEWLKSAADEMAKRGIQFSAQISNIFTYMAAILDPRIKRELSPENLNTDKNLEEARNHFIMHYSSVAFPAVANGYTKHREETSNVSFAEEIVRKKLRTNVSSTTDELTQYLSEPLAPMSTDVLEWWKTNSTRYPSLSVMARDYLAVQGTSVEPEKLFSSKADDIQKQRYCLPHGSMQVILCIQSWAQNGYNFRHRSSKIDYEKLADAATASGNANCVIDKKQRRQI